MQNRARTGQPALSTHKSLRQVGHRACGSLADTVRQCSCARTCPVDRVIRQGGGPHVFVGCCSSQNPTLAHIGYVDCTVTWMSSSTVDGCSPCARVSKSCWVETATRVMSASSSRRQ